MKIFKIIHILIALVWFINGLFCKVLNLVPRHQQIVTEILGEAYAKELTIIIGVLEILMAIWIMSKIKFKLNAVVQIVIVATMNIIEFIMTPELLLWGKYNSFFAIIFIILIYLNNFYFIKTSKTKPYAFNS